MTPQEAQIIRDVFAKIRMMGAGPADPDATRAVAAELAANPAAALGLVKVVVGLEGERAALEQQAQELAAELQDLQARMPPQPAPSGGLFGGRPQTQPGPWGQGQVQPAQPGPWGQPQASGPWGGGQPQQGGGFWSSALRTGAGVAGGLFAFEALKGIFGGHGGGAGGYGGGGIASGLFDQGPTVIENVNVFEGDRGGGGFGGGFGGEAPAREQFVADDIDFTGGGSDDDSLA